MENSELFELLETATNACDNFIKSEIALNDGDVEASQKFSKNGQTLVKALIKDTFVEIAEDFDIAEDGVNDYDYPNVLELIKALNEISMFVASLLSSSNDQMTMPIYKRKILKANNTVKEIFISLYEN